MKKKLLFRGLALVTVLMTALSAHAEYALERDGIYYDLVDDSNGNTAAEVTYKDTYYNSYSGSVTIPGTIIQSWLHGNEIPVISIGQYAFRNCTNLTNVDIGYNVERIGYDAFWNCTSLREIEIPDNVKTIDYWAFEGCSGLNYLYLGSGLTSIGGSAFSGCAALMSVHSYATTPPTITSTTFPSIISQQTILVVPTPGVALAYENDTYWSKFCSIYTDKNYDFVYNGIYYAINGSNTVSVSNGDFSANYSGSLTIPATVTYGGKTYKVTSIGIEAFYDCDKLTSVTIGSNVTTIGSDAFYGTSITSITIPDNVKYIRDYGFAGASKLKEVNIGKGVTSIGADAFRSDNALTKIIVQATTPPEADGAFESYTHSNARLIVPKGYYNAYSSANEWKKFSHIYEMNYDFYVNGIYYKKTGSNTASVCRSLDEPSYDYTGTVTIPATVTYSGTTYKVTGIDDYAFYDCSVTKVNIGSNVTTIGDAAFCGSNITSMTIPNTVTLIKGGAFESCGALKTITLGSGITVIKDHTFTNSGLTSITIPNNVTSIESSAFYSCESLSSLSIGNGVTTIGEDAFGYCVSLATVTIPNNVKTIAKEAFYYCTALKTLNIGSGVTSIGNVAFGYCEALTAIKCDATTPPTIRSDTFYPSSIYSKATLTVPTPTAVTAYKAANYWKNFTNILADHEYDFVVNGIYYKITGTSTVSVTYKDANYNSYTTSSVTVPASVTYSGTSYKVTAIGEHAFRKCTALTKVTIGSNVVTIGQYAFYNSGLKTVTIPDKVTTVKTCAFASCSSLTTVTIGKGVTSIAAQSFDSPITSVTCNAATPPTMSNTNAFRTSTYDNATLYVPATSLSAYKSASGWRYFAKIQAIGGASNGDTNGDGNIDVADVTALIAAILNGTYVDPAIGDINGDGNIDVADATMLISRILNGN